MATTTDTVRLIVYQDKQANGATIAVLDLLETANYQSFNNLSNSGRFRVLMDRTHTLVAASAIAGPSTGEDGMNFTFFKQLNMPIEFSAGAGVIAEICTNNIGVLAISRGGGVLLDSKFRLRFTDS